MTDEGAGSAPRVTIQPYGGALIASIQVDVDDRVLRRLQADLLEAVRRDGSKAVLIDLAGVELLDAEDFAGLRRIVDAVSLMGAETVLCGVRPGVAASLVRLDAPVDGLRTELSLDTALAAISRGQDGRADPEEGPDPEDDDDERGRVADQDPE